MKFSKKRLIGQFKANGLHFTERQIVSEGDYSLEDAIWNYVDAVSHIKTIHKLVDNFPVAVDKDRLISLFFQKVLGFRFPIVLVDNLTDKYTQVAFTSYLFFILIVDNTCTEVSKTRTRVTTIYHIGTPKWCRFLAPLIFWILKRNYKELMSTDIPLRERRGALRSCGYRFRSDKDLNYQSAINIGLDNVIPPKHLVDTKQTVLDISPTILHGETLYFGIDDHRGLKILKFKNQLLCFRRMCLHEGASMDCAKVVQGKSACPWHGRSESPVATFDLHEKNTQTVSTDVYELTLTNNELTIRPHEKGDSKPAATTAEAIL